MPAIDPSSTTWTLRFKHHKTTILLHADALQTLTSIRAELLHVLRETAPEGIAGKALPDSPEEIQLAKLRDTSDPEKGWKLLTQATAEGGGGKSKGKGKSGGAGDESLKAVGVKDNAVLAFRWGGAVDNGLDGADMAIDIEGEDEEDEKGADGGWDVVWPRYDDTYIDGLDDEGIAE
ncbi:hypothetical protein B0J12DRAFT_745260 [Macrophomina phaseolina]|uniref:Uncharacterized protein n=1 Tax=Macrophomina phaseolina TaxID=35725 RepID=A0ABQ8FW24_9PEZI|nr:hypothetical protein B0J12DRAFT_745260 [Macrophomina phaseolina]